MKQPERLVLYISDIRIITGLRERSTYRLVKKIRIKYDLPLRALIPVNLFCEFTGVSEENVRKLLAEVHN